MSASSASSGSRQRLGHRRMNGSRDLGRKSMSGTASGLMDGRVNGSKKRGRLSDITESSTASLPVRKSTGQSKRLKADLDFIHPPLSSLPTGEVFVCGSNEFGELGVGLGAPSRRLLRALKFFEDKEVVKIAAGALHNLVLLKNGQVWSWGVNDEFALGRPSKSATELDEDGQPLDLTAIPGQVLGLEVMTPDEGDGVVDVEAGDSISLALTRKGAVYAWGTFRTEEGRAQFSRGVKHALVPTLVPGLSGTQMTKIVCGGNHVVGLDTRGNVWAWGIDSAGQLIRRVMSRSKDHDNFTLTPAMAVAAGRKAGAARVVNIAAGEYSTYIIYDDGTVRAAGADNYGQVGLGPGGQAGDRIAVKMPADVIHVAAGEHHAIFQTRDGKLYALGRSDSGQLGLLVQTTETGSSVRDEALELHCPPCAPYKVYAASRWTAAIGVNGEFMTWGINVMGQLAQGDEDDRKVPTQVDIKSRLAMQIGCGANHLVALLSARRDD